MLGVLHKLWPPPRIVVVNGLRTVWIILVLWYEICVFDHVLRACQWPGVHHPNLPDSRISRVLVVADPQIPDRRSYPNRGFLLNVLGQFIIDLNLRRSWCATLSRLQPNAVVFLGDLMDNGRASMSDNEYNAYAARFFDIFQMREHMPVFFLPGNHDIGLGETPSFSSEAGTRYTSFFGPRNYKTSIGNQTLLFIDSVALVKEDFIRAHEGYSYDNWPAVEGGPVDFVKRFASNEHVDPTVLFTHIPLARPLKADCGPLRERGTIRQGYGFGYQNTLSDDASQFLLGLLRPSLILSGDDHDYCEYSHPLPLPSASGSTTVKEISVKSFSMAMGIRRPGFQLLLFRSTTPSSETLTQLPDSPSPVDAPCFLPDQLGIYLTVYVPFIVLSLLSLLAFNIHRTRTWNNRQQRRMHEVPLRSSHPDRSAGRATSEYELSRRSRSNTEDTGEDLFLPPPVMKFTKPARSSELRGRPSSCSRAFPFLRVRRRLASLQSSRVEYGMHEVGLVRGFLSDVLDVAWPPILAFCVAAWWTMHF